MLSETGMHKQILAGFQREPTVEDKYGVHFKYQDLFSRLMTVKIEREGKAKALTRRKSTPKNCSKMEAYVDSIQGQSDALTERTARIENLNPKNRKSMGNLKINLPNKKNNAVKRSLSPLKSDLVYLSKEQLERVRTANRKNIMTRAKSTIDKRDRNTLGVPSLPIKMRYRTKNVQ